ncbi:MAG: c-type cytochrome [Magnetospirillum sp.]|nr:c-type cytochrome [Magnetospirillum sp.]
MKAVLAVAVAVALSPLLITGALAAEESEHIPRLVSNVCSKCHGIRGDSQSSLFPRLAGQQADYIVKQLKAFRSHGRADPHAEAYMWGIAGPLADAQMKQLADYFASQPPIHGQPASNTALAAQGKDIYEKGVADQNIPACQECHGKKAEGQGEIPRLAGQHRDYLFRQIRDFRVGLRANAIMHENAKSITDDEALAIATYLASQ